MKKTLPMAWQKASSQMNMRPPKKTLYIMIKLKKKKNQKNREKLKNAIFSIHINEIRFKKWSN